jgi:hypothetical protein
MAQEFDGTLTLDQTGFAYSTSAGPFQAQPWPRYAYHATEAPRIVSSKEEFQTLEPDGWTLQYQHKDYPKMMFAPNGDTAVVNNPEEETAQASAEGGPWADAPHGSTDPQSSITRHSNFTLQEKADAIRDSRRLSLDYVQLNQSLDCHADNAPMRAINPQDVPRPQFKPVETPEQIEKRREREDEERRQRGEHVEHTSTKAKNDKKNDK